MNQEKQIENNNFVSQEPINFLTSKKHEYKYWKTKPVIKDHSTILYSQNIESNLKNRKIYSSDESIALPNRMEWKIVNIDDQTNLNELHGFLMSYYYDSNIEFKYNFTNEFLKWSLGNENISISINIKNTNEIIGFISAKIQNLTVFEITKKFAIVTFLCAHPNYRKKNMTQILIDELIRRCVNLNIQQGCFLTPKFIPTPTTTFRTYFRPINYIKLQQCDFIDLELMKAKNKKNPEKIQNMLDADCVQNIKCEVMTMNHIADVYKIYKTFVSKYNIHKYYTTDDFIKLLLNNPIVKCFVFFDEKNEIVDFFSYYKLDYLSTKENLIKGAHMYLYSCNMSAEKFIKNIFGVLKNDFIDILHVVDSTIMPELIYSQELKVNEDSDDESFTKSYQYGFLKGPEKKYFNFFNWQCPSINSNQICFEYY